MDFLVWREVRRGVGGLEDEVIVVVVGLVCEVVELVSVSALFEEDGGAVWGFDGFALGDSWG